MDKYTFDELDQLFLELDNKVPDDLIKKLEHIPSNTAAIQLNPGMSVIVPIITIFLFSISLIVAYFPFLSGLINTGLTFISVKLDLVNILYASGTLSALMVFTAFIFTFSVLQSEKNNLLHTFTK